MPFQEYVRNYLIFNIREYWFNELMNSSTQRNIADIFTDLDGDEQ